MQDMILLPYSQNAYMRVYTLYSSLHFQINVRVIKLTTIIELP